MQVGLGQNNDNDDGGNNIKDNINDAGGDVGNN